ncbi:Serine/threonine-protein phosphatase 5 [Smittium culicis]|uniref:Serine/threonine-protein phosphatase 5 n=1 Tax=Smittium culicis TaxID=133412 RepID=A0A1R1YGQ5_9FUNG|nr:Serine/threonine-protein phosphatase 5 [Smittium culicis]
MPNSSADVQNDENIKKAENIKLEANALFAEKKYNQAMEKYTEAITLNPSVPAYYTNRAQCYILTEGYGAAIMYLHF